MPIHFIPNDPLAAALNTPRREGARPNRPAGRAGFRFASGVPQGLFAPGSPEFLFWQSREAALNAVATWESIAAPLTRWARSSDPKRIALLADAGEDLNAYYDGESLAFFHFTTGAKTTFSGASTDVVAHECGHALLDAIRPDLWFVNTVEAGAFHEAFGDCMALLTALRDRPTRIALLAATADLSRANFVEATAEDLSDGVRRAAGAAHPASKPRQALNAFRYTLPTLLPAAGGPDVLTREVHSFGRIFSGCFYDLIRLVYLAGARRGQAALEHAARIAGRLLVAGAQSAVVSPRFFQAVGRAMALADDGLHGGAHRVLVQQAFQNHGIALGTNALLAPRAALAGPAPRVAREGRIAAATERDIRRRLAPAPGARMTSRSIRVGALAAVEVVRERMLGLAAVDVRLRNVLAVAHETVLVGGVQRRAAVLGTMPEPVATDEEVEAFVQSLLATGQLALDGAAAPRGRRPRGRAPAPAEMPPGATHVVEALHGRRTVRRARFACGCARHLPFRLPRTASA
jgi:hypothetical protein